MSNVSRLLPTVVKLNQETLDKHCKKNEGYFQLFCGFATVSS